jgi:O-succinylbenzoic acid--CoA ligase
VTGGEKVMPLEVEQAIANCPGVRAACAFGIADPVWGQLVAAAIVAADSFDLESLPATLKARLSSHQRPRRVALIDELPLTASGKVDRRALAKLSSDQLRPLLFS